MRKKLLLLFSLLLFIASSLSSLAQNDSEGWSAGRSDGMNVALPRLSDSQLPAVTYSGMDVLERIKSQPQPSLNMASTSVKREEMKQLAKQLENDPLRIFEFVYNEIDYEHYWGSRKGSILTYRERSGNDLDQCRLLVDLLYFCGVKNLYFTQVEDIIAYESSDGNDLIHWLGLSANPYADMTVDQLLLKVYKTEANIPAVFKDQSLSNDLFRKQMLQYLLHRSSLGIDGNHSATTDPVLFRIIDDNGTPRLGIYVRRFVVKCDMTIGSDTVLAELDPSLKYYTWHKAQDIALLMGYDNENSLLAALGGIATANSVKQVNYDAFSGQMKTYWKNLTDGLSGSALSGKSIQEVFGGRILKKRKFTNMAEAMNRTQYYRHDFGKKEQSGVWKFSASTDLVAPYGNIISILGDYNFNAEKKSELRVPQLRFYYRSGAGNQLLTSLDMDSLRGDALYFTGTKVSASSYTLSLMQDDNGNVKTLKNLSFTSSNTSIYVCIVHPEDNNVTIGGVPYPYTQLDFIADGTRMMTIPYAFRMSKEWVEKRKNALQESMNSAEKLYPSALGADGKLNLSHASVPVAFRTKVARDILNLKGLTWLLQTQKNAELLGGLCDFIPQWKHRVGRIVFNGNGTYIDVFGDSAFVHERNSISDNYRFFPQVLMTFNSALEHSVLEQQNVSTTASTKDAGVSTVRVLKWAATETAANDEILFVTHDTWDTMKPAIQTAYGASFASIESFFEDNQNSFGLFPKSGYYSKGSFGGGGYFYTQIGGVFRTSFMLDSLNGGRQTIPENVYGPHKESMMRITDPGWANNTKETVTMADPVDVVTGAFLLTEVDLSLGKSEPHGLSFTRFYNSQKTDENTAGIGYGWTHGYHMYLEEIRSADLALGMGTPTQAAAWASSLVVAQKVWASRIQTGTMNAKSMLIPILSANWASERLLDAGIVIDVAGARSTYTSLPDGSYASPAGSTAVLKKDSETGLFSLKYRNANEFRFYPISSDLSAYESGKVKSITDPFGNNLTFEYNYGILKTVTDTYGRKLEFIYDSQNKRFREIKEIAGNLNSTLTLNYDTANNLISVSGPNRETHTCVYYTDAGTKTQEEKKHLIVGLNKGTRFLTNTYDDKNRVTRQVFEDDKNGNTHLFDRNGRRAWTFEYFDNHTVETMPFYEGDTLLSSKNTYYFDDSKRVTQKRDALGYISTVTYDHEGRITRETDAKGNASSFVYNGDHTLKESTDKIGNKISYEYDDKCRLTKTTAKDMTSGEERSQRFTFSGNNPNPATAADARNITTNYVYNSNGSINSVTGPDGTVTYSYDNYGNITQVQTVLGIESRSEYNSRGWLLHQWDAKGNKVSYEYLDGGYLSKVFETPVGLPQIQVSFNEYDNYGKLTSLTQWQSEGVSRKISYIYNKSGKVVQAREGTNVLYRNIYNEQDWLIGTVDAENAVTKYEYDVLGRVQATVRYFNTFQYTHANFGYYFNSLYFPASTANDRRSEVSYDELGNVIKSKDPLANEVNIEYDRLGRPLRTTDAMNYATRNTYNGFGERTALTFEGDNSVYAFAYNPNGSLLTTTNPLSRVRTNSYFAGSNRLQKTMLPSGKSAEFVYNTVGLLTQRTTGLGSTAYTYDGNRNIATVHSTDTDYTVTYDWRNRISSVDYASHGVATNFAYTYDWANNVTGIKYPDGTWVTYKYDLYDRMTEVKDAQGRLTTYEYDKVGRVKKVTRPNSTRRELTWNVFGELQKVEELLGNGSLIASFEYEYDKVGRIIRETQKPDFGQAFSYVKQQLTHDRDNQINSVSVSGESAVPMISYDVDGNMTGGRWSVRGQKYATVQQYENDILTQADWNYLSLEDDSTYTFNQENRLNLVTNKNRKYKRNGSMINLFSAYKYDTDGRRVIADNNGIESRYYNDFVSGKVLRKTTSDVNGTEKNRYYVYGLGLLYEVEGSSMYTHHYDMRGSMVAMTNESGAVVSRMAYDPYGNIVAYNSNIETDYLFCGALGVQTDNTGLLYMQNRYYSPFLGRFISQDPIGFNGGLNLYAYASGNPIQFADPLGLCTQASVWEHTKAIAGYAADDVSNGLNYGANYMVASYHAWRNGPWFDGKWALSLSTEWQDRLLALQGNSGFNSVGNFATAQTNTLLGTDFPINDEYGESAIAGQASGVFIFSYTGSSLIMQTKAMWQSTTVMLNGLKSTASAPRWVYGAFKSEAKWTAQFRARGWTSEQVTEAMSSSEIYSAINNVNKANSATRYVHPITRKSIVVDDVTNELLHVGGEGFMY